MERIGIILCILVCVHCGTIYDDSITFLIVPGSELPMFNSSFNESLSSRGCYPHEKFFIIVHGWLESWKTEWDYSNYSMNSNYFLLTPHFANISNVFLKFLIKLDKEGFDFNNGYMFGFSYGAWLAIKTAKTFGNGRFAQIDVCDPAGPGFDYLIDMGDISLAAQNVQCIHTNSGGYGTILRNCSQNWLMGICGIAQIGASIYPKGHHGLCPYYYTAAFKYDFVAWQNIYACYTTRIVTNYPELFRMGYKESLEKKSSVIGDLFSPTSMFFPYNEILGRTSTTINPKSDEFMNFSENQIIDSDRNML
ncbi:hypothetical protein PVAND_004170 [Polypedilum vanderplanki]|uniref:Lipase domain-containing protein n=1 Tax=Polypedilum vanderplanki TaxID=319348 RepID=A0A9J6BXB3_POLVA|nr:hypothetical protein PVAND_004170 [Polypedilum vanderplanki]